ncbi:ABC transporter permease subunit [Actinomadura atramentaria]|uniref:ABC transporter permease subunit n=1 Tax=Actinomadura atramentaria TaxID=1990 RepID=UPI0003610256|nr:ABC transporter permease subunit [Actinomadura atramentaria]
MTGDGYRGAVLAEWTRFWSLRSTWWGLLSAFPLMGIVATTLANSVTANNTDSVRGNDQGVVATSGVALDALDLVQFVPLTLAILLVTGEYAHGGMRVALACVPSRARLLAAKATVVAAVFFPLGAALAVAGTVACVPFLGKWGHLSAGDAVADALACGLYLALVGVLALCVGTMLRSTAGALTTVFLVLLVLPMLLGGGQEIAERIGDALPSVAGRHFMKGDADPYPAAAGLAILLVWIAAALAGGYAALRERDA